jgi:UrcA family protein
MNAQNFRGMKNTLIAALAGLSLTVMTGIAVAAARQADSLPAITVKYDAVAATTPAGAEALYKKIKSAAARVCERYESQELVRRTPWQKCYSQVVESAVAAVHQPVLTALHENNVSTNPRG